MPSKEAMDAAEKYIYPYDSAGDGFDTVMCFERCLFLEDEPPDEVERITKLYRADLATALDDHTATLRAEVEALRARLLQAQAVLEPISEILGEPKLGYVGSADKIEHEARVYEAVNERLRTGLALLELSE